MPKHKNLWDTSSVKNVYHFQTKEEKDYLKKIDDINYKIIELNCEIDCLVQKKNIIYKKLQRYRIRFVLFLFHHRLFLFLHIRPKNKLYTYRIKI